MLTSHLRRWSPAPEGVTVHAADDRALEVYTYVQELRTWHRDPAAAEALYGPSAEEFAEVAHEEVYGLLREVPRYDRRDEALREAIASRQGQVRRSGEVLTSAEVGLVTKHLPHRPAYTPLIGQLVETRSQHKRWTALALYPEDGPARRKMTSALNNADGRVGALKTPNERGHHLEHKHRRRRFTIDGTTHTYWAVEIKYCPRNGEDEG